METIRRKIDETSGYAKLPVDDYYIASDNYCYLLLRDLNKTEDVKFPSSKETKTYKTYELIGYFTTVEGCLKEFRRHVVRTYTASEDEKTIEDVVGNGSIISELINKCEQLGI